MRRTAILPRAALICLLAAVALAAAPSIAKAANCETAPTWAGTGIEPWAGSLQTTINNASTGETVVVPNGSYSSFTLSKNVRVIAQNHYGAVASTARQTAGWIEGFHFTGSAVNGGGATGIVVFANNRHVGGNSGQQYTAFRTGGKHIIWDNDFRDTDGTVSDYAVQFYGSTGAEVCHNYFYGQYNQVVSFKEGNRDYSIAYNAVQGGQNGAGLFAGQNNNTNGLGWDTGLIQIHHNYTSRAVSSSGANLYRGKDPIRVGYLRNADVRIYDNVCVGTHQGCVFIWVSGTGRVTMTDNAGYARANGNVFSSFSGCIYGSGSGYTLTSNGFKCYDAPTSTRTVAGSNPPRGSANPTVPNGPNPTFDYQAERARLLGEPAPAPTPTPTPSPNPTPTPTPTPTPVTTGHTVDSDTFVRSDLPTQNFNDETLLQIDGDPIRRTLLAWDDVPAGATMVVLRVYVDWATDERFDIRKGSCTYSPPNVTYDANGLGGGPVPQGPIIASVASDSSVGWKEITLPASQFTANWNCLQVDKTGSLWSDLRSMEHSAGTYAPRLVVTRQP